MHPGKGLCQDSISPLAHAMRAGRVQSFPSRARSSGSSLGSRDWRAAVYWPLLRQWASRRAKKAAFWRAGRAASGWASKRAVWQAAW